ncbi:unnamed protein product [Blepharisma stoltei]|uniref:Uncharacterized protein n=1 Tax=Blepharisma stoltei TaxID=1481888 RepID=A0AAU9IL88_9CILI|nr:unnamed protein product [Blepharisma stoltei]
MEVTNHSELEKYLIRTKKEREKLRKIADQYYEDLRNRSIERKHLKSLSCDDGESNGPSLNGFKKFNAELSTQLNWLVNSPSKDKKNERRVWRFEKTPESSRHKINQKTVAIYANKWPEVHQPSSTRASNNPSLQARYKNSSAILKSRLVSSAAQTPRKSKSQLRGQFDISRPKIDIKEKINT